MLSWYDSLQPPLCLSQHDSQSPCARGSLAAPYLVMRAIRRQHAARQRRARLHVIPFGDPLSDASPIGSPPAHITYCIPNVRPPARRVWRFFPPPSVRRAFSTALGSAAAAGSGLGSVRDP